MRLETRARRQVFALIGVGHGPDHLLQLIEVEHVVERVRSAYVIGVSVDLMLANPLSELGIALIARVNTCIAFAIDEDRIEQLT